jgi:SagB-type dehydrogenase family enzyme
MNGLPSLTTCLLLLTVLVPEISAQTRAPGSIQLREPQTEGGKPLMQTLKERKTTREFRNEKLPDQVLSNLLWAAFGINRPESGRRTAPSAMNWQEIDIYVISAEGLYLYEAKGHLLKSVKAEDLRAQAGTQAFVQDAPINLIYVADTTRMGQASQEEREIYAAADTGFIAENVYLFCASEGLATVVRASVDKPVLAKAMLLQPEQKIILAQSVGYPKK